MPKHFAIALMLLLIGGYAQAASPAANRAASVVETLSERAQNIDSISGLFEQTRKISVLTHPLTSNGDFYYSRTEGLKWNNLAPFQNSITVSPQQELSLTDQNGETTHIQASHFMSRIFLGLLLGDFKALENVFSIKEETLSSGWKLTLTPPSAKIANGLERISIIGSQTINDIVLEYTNQDQTVIKLTQQKVLP